MTSAISLSRDSVNVRALNPAIVGKFMDARTPLAFMSLTRSCTSKQPGRSSEYAPGLKPHSSRGQPTVAAMPNGVEVRSPWNTHSSTPCSLRTTLGISSRHLAGTWFSYMSGGSIMWSSMLTRIMSSGRMARLLCCTGSAETGSSADDDNPAPGRPTLPARLAARGDRFRDAWAASRGKGSAAHLEGGLHAGGPVPGDVAEQRVGARVELDGAGVLVARRLDLESEPLHVLDH